MRLSTAVNEKIVIVLKFEGSDSLYFYLLGKIHCIIFRTEIMLLNLHFHACKTTDIERKPNFAILSFFFNNVKLVLILIRFFLVYYIFALKCLICFCKKKLKIYIDYRNEIRHNLIVNKIEIVKQS